MQINGYVCADNVKGTATPRTFRARDGTKLREIECGSDGNSCFFLSVSRALVEDTTLAHLLRALSGIAVAATLQPQRDECTAAIMTDDLATRDAHNAAEFVKIARQAMTDALYAGRCVDSVVGTVLMNALGVSSEVLVESGMGLTLRWNDMAVCSGGDRTCYLLHNAALMHYRFLDDGKGPIFAGRSGKRDAILRIVEVGERLILNARTASDASKGLVTEVLSLLQTDARALAASEAWRLASECVARFTTTQEWSDPFSCAPAATVQYERKPAYFHAGFTVVGSTPDFILTPVTGGLPTSASDPASAVNVQFSDFTAHPAPAKGVSNAFDVLRRAVTIAKPTAQRRGRPPTITAKPSTSKTASANSRLSALQHIKAPAKVPCTTSPAITAVPSVAASDSDTGTDSDCTDSDSMESVREMCLQQNSSAEITHTDTSVAGRKRKHDSKAKSRKDTRWETICANDKLLERPILDTSTKGHEAYLHSRVFRCIVCTEYYHASTNSLRSHAATHVKRASNASDLSKFGVRVLTGDEIHIKDAVKELSHLAGCSLLANGLSANAIDAMRGLLVDMISAAGCLPSRSALLGDVREGREGIATKHVQGLVEDIKRKLHGLPVTIFVDASHTHFSGGKKIVLYFIDSAALTAEEGPIR